MTGLRPEREEKSRPRSFAKDIAGQGMARASARVPRRVQVCLRLAPEPVWLGCIEQGAQSPERWHG